jgi:CheY-like chemotaxis protein
MTQSEVLLVDDNPADIDLTTEVLGRSACPPRIRSVIDGMEAISFLRHEGRFADAPCPDLIVLDLNLPRKDGRQVLGEVKSQPDLAKIPVVVFTTSEASSDVNRSYELGANSYLRKPGNLADFQAAVASMAGFWLGVAILPYKEKQ